MAPAEKFALFSMCIGGAARGGDFTNDPGSDAAMDEAELLLPASVPLPQSTVTSPDAEDSTVSPRNLKRPRSVLSRQESGGGSGGGGGGGKSGSAGRGGSAGKGGNGSTGNQSTK